MRFSELLERNDAVRNNRGIRNCFVVTRKPLSDGKTIEFFVRTIKEPQDGGRNIVTLRPLLTKKRLWKLIENKETKLRDVKVAVGCTCKDYQFGGAHYNLSQNLLQIGEREKRPPVITDPNREHFLCKHIAKVFDRFKNNTLYDMYMKRGLG